METKWKSYTREGAALMVEESRRPIRKIKKQRRLPLSRTGLWVSLREGKGKVSGVGWESRRGLEF